MRTKEDIEKEYNLKHKEYRELVGNLYPSIVYKQLLELRKEYKALDGEPNDLPPVAQPQENGYR